MYFCYHHPERKATRWVATVGLPSGVHPMCGHCCRSKREHYEFEYENGIDGQEGKSVIERDPNFEEDFTVGYHHTLPVMVWSKMKREDLK